MSFWFHQPSISLEVYRNTFSFRLVLLILLGYFCLVLIMHPSMTPFGKKSSSFFLYFNFIMFHNHYLTLNCCFVLQEASLLLTVFFNKKNILYFLSNISNIMLQLVQTPPNMVLRWLTDAVVAHQPNSYNNYDSCTLMKKVSIVSVCCTYHIKCSLEYFQFTRYAFS